MISITGIRSSPRFINRLCNGFTIPSLSSEQTATLLSLAHCTGWSADAISNKFAEATGIELPAEIVWDYHWSWVFGRNQDAPEDISTLERNIMHVLARNIGVEIGTPKKPLSQTARPTTIKFAAQWSAKYVEDRPLFPGWTALARDATKGLLLRQNSSMAYGELTEIEERVMAKFGENMLYILRKTLKMWAMAMMDLVRQESGLRPIREREHVDLIMKYLMIFQGFLEERFGKMDTGKHASAFGEIKDNTVFIKSTGYGVKVVLGLIMADRMHVVERKRRLEREVLGFVEAKVEDLEHDSTDCPICQDPMGVESPDGAREAPLRLVICCGQVIGSQCLKAWLVELVFEHHRDTCPICRYKFPASFMEALFTGEEYAARLASQMEEVDLLIPSPTAVRSMRSQQEQDFFLQGEMGSGELDDDSDLVYINNINERIISPLVTMIRTPMTIGGAVSNEIEHGELREDEI